MKGEYAHLDWDLAYLSKDGKTYELDLVTLQVKESDKHFDEPIVLAETSTDRTIDVGQTIDFVSCDRQERFDNRYVRSLIIIPTWACSARCTYCYVAKVREDTVMLTADKVEEALEKYKIDPRKIRGTIFIGGDPVENLDAVEYCIDKFENANHTVCTGFVGDDATIERLLDIVMFNPKVEISLSLDPPESGRYKFDQTYNRNIMWLETFKKFIGKRIRVKSTLNANAYKISELRKVVPEGTHISFDGAGYGFGKIKNVERHILDGIKKEFDIELQEVIDGKPILDSYFSFHRSAIDMINGEQRGQTCSCGMEYFTLLPSGDLSYCDSPERPILDENLNHPELSLKMEGKKPCGGGGICDTCQYQRFCGGSCGITKQHELYCYVKILDFVYSAYLNLFGVLDEHS